MPSEISAMQHENPARRDRLSPPSIVVIHSSVPAESSDGGDDDDDGESLAIGDSTPMDVCSGGRGPTRYEGWLVNS